MTLVVIGVVTLAIIGGLALVKQMVPEPEPEPLARTPYATTVRYYDDEWPDYYEPPDDRREFRDGG